MDRFNSEIEEAPPGLARCLECDIELYAGDTTYEFSDGETVCDDCVIGYVNKWFRRTL